MTFKPGDTLTAAQADALNTLRRWFGAMKMNNAALERAARAMVRECQENERTESANSADNCCNY